MLLTLIAQSVGIHFLIQCRMTFILAASTMSDKVLVIGSGGREHALSWKLAQSDQIKDVFVAPGNAGTFKSGKISNVGEWRKIYV